MAFIGAASVEFRVVKSDTTFGHQEGDGADCPIGELDLSRYQSRCHRAQPMGGYQFRGQTGIFQGSRTAFPAFSCRPLHKPPFPPPRLLSSSGPECPFISCAPRLGRPSHYSKQLPLYLANHFSLHCPVAFRGQQQDIIFTAYNTQDYSAQCPPISSSSSLLQTE